MVNPITEILGTGSTSGTTQTDKAQTTKDQFLKLLLAQMKNQDPLNAPDVNQLSDQITQFGQLEQLFNLNSSMDNLNSLQGANQKSQAIGMIGKKVEAFGNKFKINAQDEAKYGYVLPQSAKMVRVDIYNDSGKLVRTIKQENVPAGRQFEEFDKLDSQGGTLSNGNYTFKVFAENDDGGAISVQPAVEGLVTGIEFSSYGTVIKVGDASIVMEDVFSVKS